MFNKRGTSFNDILDDGEGGYLDIWCLCFNAIVYLFIFKITNYVNIYRKLCFILMLFRFFSFNFIIEICFEDIHILEN